MIKKTYEQVSKNIIKGDQIKDIRELVALAKNKNSVVVRLGGTYIVRPAAVMINWSLGQLSGMQIFYSIKLN